MRSGQKRGMVETNIKVAFVYYSFSSFVKNDYEILSKHFDVIKVNYRQIWDVYKIMMAVMRSDVSFTWFAGGHAVIAVLFSKIFRKKSIVIAGGGDVASVPEIDYGGMRQGTRSRVFAKFVLENADVILAVSKFTEQEVLKHAKPKKTIVVYNGVDVNKFVSCGENREVVVTTVAHRGKNVIKLKGIKTFSETATYFPTIKFIVIGLSGKRGSFLDELNPPKNVEFVSFLPNEELIRYYQKARIYCQLSYRESFGMALAEAMSCGCVPVVTDRGALPEVVGDTGFCVPYGDPKATVEAIKDALNSNKGKEARERIKNMFAIEKRSEKLIELINELTRC